MAVASWMLRNRNFRISRLRSRAENRDDVVNLDFNLDTKSLTFEVLSNVCKKQEISSVKKLNYLNAFVQLLSKRPSDDYGLSNEDLLCCLKLALIQDSVQIRAAGLRAIRHVIKTEDDVISLNRLHIPYLIARSLDLEVKTENERVLMSERMQSLKLMRRVLSVSPRHFSKALVRALISAILRPVEESDRLLKACISTLCEVCILNSLLFIECDGARALLRNVTLNSSSHMAEAICGSLLFLLNKPVIRHSANVDINYLISSYTNLSTNEKRTNSREEERTLTWTNSALLTVLRSCSGIFQMCGNVYGENGLKDIVHALYINQQNARKAILELIFELLNVPQPTWTDDENIALESVDPSRFQDSFQLTEGFLVAEGRCMLPTLSKNRSNLTEVHTALMVYCLLEAGLPDVLVEVIISSDVPLSIRATILLGQLMHLTERLLPTECYRQPPPLPNLISYAVRGCPCHVFFPQSPSTSLSAPLDDESPMGRRESLRDSDLSHSSKSSTPKQWNGSRSPGEEPDVELPSSASRRHRAASAIATLAKLRSRLERPRVAATLWLANVLRYGDVERKRKHRRIPSKQFEDLIKETAVLLSPEAFRWKWESIRILFKVCLDDSKKLNDTNFKALMRKLIYYYKPSSKKYGHIPSLSSSGTANLCTVVGCELLDVLLDEKNVDGPKFLTELLNDLNIELKRLVEEKSVHDCLLSPQSLTNSLSRDYFLIIGRLSNTDAGILMLNKLGILDSLYKIATTVTVDYYIKLILSSLSYIDNESTRRIYVGVLNCKVVSLRIYATRYLHTLLRMSTAQNNDYKRWIIEMLVNQLQDADESISIIALNALDEAADDKKYLEIIISLRPSFLHFGDKGLFLLIRFLSVPEGFAYLQEANFVVPQLLRWASFFNIRYTQLVEAELQDSLCLHRRGEDGHFLRRRMDSKIVVKDVFVPPHLYGQLVQHSQGFNLLLKHEHLKKLINIVLTNECDTDESIIELKSAIWTLGHFSTSSAGFNYMLECNVIKTIVNIAEKCVVYSLKGTAFYVLSMIATTKEGANGLNKIGWKSLKQSRDIQWPTSFENVDSPVDMLEKMYEDEESDSLTSRLDFESPQDETKQLFDHNEEIGSSFKSFEKFKSATLPQRGGFYSQIQHNRSLSESKADAFDDWSSSGSPPSTLHKFVTDIRSSSDQMKCHSGSYCTESSTSGISSCDSVHGRPSNFNERIHMLSPIPSSSSLSTVLSTIHKERRAIFSKRRVSTSVGSRLSYYKPRLLHHSSSSAVPSLSASATIEYVTAIDRRQMSPLVRPKFLRHVHQPLMHYFEVKEDSPVQEIMDTSMTIESSQFSHSTEIENDKEINGPCYRGICLPVKLCYFLNENPKRWGSLSNTYSSIAKLNDEWDPHCSDSELRTNLRTYGDRRRRHERSSCLLCSSKLTESGRCRKTSGGSFHRIRTETESSHGGLNGTETDSPIFFYWQQKPTGLTGEMTSGVGDSSYATEQTADESLDASRISEDNAMKSRTILRKEVLKMIEQLGNPTLFRTCKMGLLQLKQFCSDLFQDVCLFSDACLMLEQINYRIQARQLIQDMFLEATFYELYEEPQLIVKMIAPSTDLSSKKHELSPDADRVVAEDGRAPLLEAIAECDIQPEVARIEQSPAVSDRTSLIASNEPAEEPSKQSLDETDANRTSPKISDGSRTKNDIGRSLSYPNGRRYGEWEPESEPVRVSQRAQSYPVTEIWSSPIAGGRSCRCLAAITGRRERHRKMATFDAPDPSLLLRDNN